MAILGLFSGNEAHAYIPKKSVSATEIEIEQGESVWSISEKFDEMGLLEQHFTGDAVMRVSKSKNQILQANNLTEEDARRIQVGSTIVIPFTIQEFPGNTIPQTPPESLAFADDATGAERDALKEELTAKNEENNALALQLEEMERLLREEGRSHEEQLASRDAELQTALAEKNSSAGSLMGIIPLAVIWFLVAGVAGFIFGRYRKKNTIADLKTKVDSLSTEVSQLSEEKKRLSSENKKLCSDVGHFKRVIASLEKMRDRLNGERDEATGDVSFMERTFQVS